MHYSAKRDLAIACRLSVTLVDHVHCRVKILETNCVNNSPNIIALCNPDVIHLLSGNMEKFLGEKMFVQLLWIMR